MRRIALALAASCLAAFAGCSNPYELATVQGRVLTCEGKPAAGGVVIFRPIDDPEATGRKKGNPGREARGTVADDGTFTLTTIGIEPSPGAVTGRHTVSFQMPPTKKPVLLPDEKAGMSSEEAAQVEADFASRPVYPPLRCSDQIQPGEVTVVSGENNFEFKLPPK
ncbi:MAG: hypothetical protein HY000_07990 [Planctomycetes bacterium]|nr:hypothetical protein [Planctomycetota bacterium]